MTIPNKNTPDQNMTATQDKFQQAFQLHQQGQLEQAEALYEALLKEQPQHVDALHFSGVLVNQRGEFQRAVELIKQALDIAPDNAAAHSNLGLALLELKRFDEAIASYDRALILKSNNLEAHYGRANALLALNRFEEALVSYQNVLNINPDYINAHWGLSWCYLSLGDYDNGWKEYEWRQKTDDFKNNVRNFPQPQWFGEGSLRGKTIFLHNNEQGFGDTLQFCRYTKQLADLGARVILEVPRPLLRLLSKLEGVEQLIVQGSVLPAFDFHCPLLSLPLAFKTCLDSIPVNSPYLYSESDKVQHWQAVLGEKTRPRVGLVWSGNAAHKNDQNRTIALHELLALLIPDCQFISLQKELRDTDLELLSQQPLLQHHGEQINDFSNTAALCELMDVVVSVDTSVAHLAAAMGKPTWILLPFSPDWRWLLNRSDSPWYPTVRLFRQKQCADWRGVIEQLQQELIKLSTPDQVVIEIQQPSQSVQNNVDLFPQAFGLHRQGQLEQAEALYEVLLEQQPQHVDALHFLGVLLNQCGQSQRAVDLISKSLKINPDNAAAHSNLGLALHALKRYEEAITSYDSALSLKPDNAEAFYNRGNALLAFKDLESALSDFQHALAIKPDYIEALSNRGIVLRELSRFDEALSNYQRILEIKPDSAEAEHGCGVILQDLKRYKDAIIHYGRALAIKPELEFIAGTQFYLKMNICDWSDFEHHLDCIAKGIERGEKIAIPFSVLAMFSSGDLQKKVACRYAETKYPDALLLPRIAKHSHAKIKIGYFSADFRHHPVSYLAAQLFERHDRSRFEIIAFSLYVTTQKDDMRLRLEAAFDRFIDVSQQSDEQIVQLARELEIDIAIDLNGCTEGGRTGIFAMRAAPIQVNYLGYSGTMGAEYMDYVLGDSVLIPADYQRYYTEKVAWLPGSFMVNDNTRAISNRVFTRTELGLPEQGFVFCCFNNAYKISPTIFDIWMRLLLQVEGSVLWLVESHVDVVNNLQSEAKKRGIAGERLVFAQRLPLLSDHLARHRLADLFLDTLPYNAHATTSDALWSGLPVLTCPGEAFASRVAASLLNAIGLPELITDNLEHYEALALKLATHPEQLAAIKQKLANNRLTYPLFDTALFTRHIEQAYQAMYERYQAGLDPDHIYVSSQQPEQDRKLPNQQSDDADTLYNRGNEQLAHQQFEQALNSYNQALAIQPDHAQALSNRGIALQYLGRFEQALASYERAVSCKPDYVDALYNQGTVLRALNRIDEALNSYEQALAINPDYEFLFGTWLYMKMMICDWNNYDQHLIQLTQGIEQGKKQAIPFFTHVVVSSPELQKKAAESYALAKYPDLSVSETLIKHTHQKIRLGYFSSDFRQHPVANVIAELFEHHDMSRFEIIGFSLHTGSHKDNTRLRLEAAFDQFIDVSEYSDEQVVKLARQLEIDIAIDLNGFTEGCRPNLFAMRMAPIQVNYLGFSGTMGAQYMDYILADPMVIPEQYQSCYSEKIVRLPDNFMPNDSSRAISNRKLTRAEFGLPERGFVFCCFNNPYKITPEIFDTWTRLLHEVKDSVLWLSGCSVNTANNLQREAKARGIAAERLIFAKRLPLLADHLARHSLADLFLDTLPYNAHATANDALWAGLPVLTCAGEAFASRVAASLLNATGLPELITTSLADYEALAIQLATHPKQLAAIKQKLAKQRLSYPLFDTALFTRHIESAYQIMYERYQAELTPGHIYVPAQKQMLEKKSGRFNPFGMFGKIARLAKRQKTVKTEPVQIQVDQCEDARKLYEQGQLAAAETLYKELLKTQPDHAEALNSLAAIRKQHKPAQISHPMANKDSDQLLRHLHNGLELHKLNRLDDALVSFRQALEVDANHIEVLINYGNVLEDLGRFDEAIVSYDRAISLNPTYARAHSNRGNVLQSLKRFDEAIVSYNGALAIRPDYAEAFYNRGNALQAIKDLPAAIASHEQALKLKPDFLQALVSLGNAHHDAQHYDDALDCYERALIIQPDYAEVFHNKGNVLHDFKRYEDALESYCRAIAINLDYAGAHWNSSFCHLMLGDFESGWKEYEWRWKTDDFKNAVRNFSSPQWMGDSSLQGKTILLYGEQGLGDTLHFCRYVKLVADLGAKVILEVPKLLSGLLANLEGVDRLITTGESRPAFDFHSPLLSLPLAFKTRLDTIPANIPYLFSEAAQVKKWQAILGEKTLPRVGIVWSGNPEQKNDHNRSLSLRELLPLFSSPMPCQFICLQKELRDADRELLAQQRVMEFYGDQINDFTDTAALCELMDVVISVCTSVGHLAGAMGKPTWMILSDNACWRWLLNRDDSPWYPTARLFRQTQHGDWQGVIEQVRHELIALTPENNSSEAVESLINHGNDLEDLGQFNEALACYDKALTINPDYARAHSNRGNVLQSLKRFEDALQSYERAIAIKPDYAEAFYNRGNVQQTLERFNDALDSYDEALAIKPDLLVALIARGNVLQDLKRYAEALDYYERVLAIQPDYLEILISRGSVLQNLKRFNEALVCYDRALNIKPDYVAAWADRGIVLQTLKHLDEALSCYERVLVLEPDHVEALVQRIVILQIQGLYDEAIIGCERVLAIHPEHDFMFGIWLNCKMKICDWNNFDTKLNELSKKIIQGEKAVTPFVLKALSSSPSLQKVAAEIYAQAKYPATLLLPPLVKHSHQRIRLGYFSADFRQHATSYLMAELFEFHDRSRFEIIAFSFYPAAHKDGMRLRLESIFDQFIDVSQQSDEQVAHLARKLGCDIAVDLNGFTEGCRTGIFAMRAAPIQVSYLAYPGTMGTHYMDYLLADPVLIPEQYQSCYLEKIAYLPNSYQVNDRHRPISNREFSRAESGLPEQTFVFCCFNNNHKITPDVFTRWMRILNQVENSVLWLLEDNRMAAKNLRLAATSHGIAAERLIFAQRCTVAGHLARHRLADLFLDTLPYNAHTTASDALWMGLPVLTCTGESFASRVATSLLNAIGLPELITGNLEDYEALAVKLATHPEQLAAIKQKLTDNRLSTPLFDTALFTQNIESVYQAMYDRYQADLAPDHIYAPTQINTINTDELDAVINHGNDLEDLNRLEEALSSYDRAISLNPNYARAHSNRGNVLQSLKRFDDAIASYDRALAIRPDYPEAFYNRGNALQACMRCQEAIVSYDRALAIKPDFVLALIGLGNVQLDCKRSADALLSYDRALAIQPDHAETLANRGVVLNVLNRREEALASYERALAIQPDCINALLGRGLVLTDLKRINDAIASYAQVIAIQPDYEFVFGPWLYLKMGVCDWENIEHHLDTIAKGIECGKKMAVPFSVLSMFSSLALQKKAAEIYVQEKHPCLVYGLPLIKYRHSKIKLGYFSADFQHHATAYLMAELFERHDRSRFEVIAFSFSPISSKDDMRLRLEAGFDQFIDVSQQSDEQVVQMARQLEIDIAVDLKGFTGGYRANLFAMRLAPIQVNYLGYPGTMGADYIDYLLADSVLIPEAYQPHYTEKIVYLPNSYQVNDSTRAISEKQFTRVECGLPEQGFVFCCFNNNYKIMPVVFDCWMRLLHKVESSVLWLLGDNDVTETNLRQAATERGIASERLVFAKRMVLPAHLARHRLADLFLDTLPYNAHTTTSDALWAGLPVLTCAGEAFASRVAASLLTAVGLPELITDNLEDYEALAIKLATHPEQLAAIKQKLANNRLTYPLFDTALFTQYIEQAYQVMYGRYQADLPPDHIDVAMDRAGETCTPEIQQQSADSTTFLQAFELHQQGQLAQAEVLYKATLQAQPQHADALHLLGVLASQQGQVQRAIDLITQSLDINPNNALAHNNIGLAWHALNRWDEALASYQRALAVNPDYLEALYNLGNLYLARQQFELALSNYDKALTIQSDYAEVLCNRGIALQKLKRLDDALASYDRALAIKPDYAAVLTNRGNTLKDLKRWNEAVVSYEQALALNASDLETLTNHGNILQELGRYDEALASYDRVLLINPDYTDVLCHQGIVLQDLKRWDEALVCYERALSIDPNHEFLFGSRLSLKMKICDWSDFERDSIQLKQKITNGEKAIAPFGILAQSSSVALQKAVASCYSAAKYPNNFLLPSLIKYAHSKIKIGYFSADFHHHATTYLMAELFERHDKSRFEIIAFSFLAVGNDDDMRPRLVAAFDQFIDVSQQSDEEVVRLARELEIDIAIDLKGFTQHARTELFAMRVAPIQVNYLGYPGTIGADYIDYLIADSVLIPKAYQPYYSEKIVYLPNSYQVNDSTRAISDRHYTRAECGLPEQGFVFCCFNNNYKITPAVFEIWMRLLHQVEGSVMWLLGDNHIAETNLRQEATARGIASERLVFAKRMPLSEHLARHRLADLFLDTLPCNAHTTTSDALWAGLPVLTCTGEAFASRVAASLLAAVGLSELITDNLEDYEALAFQLATHSEQLAVIKQKLANNRVTYPLFDTALFTRHIEAAYQAMYDRYQGDLPPDYIEVASNSSSTAASQANVDKFAQAMSLHHQGQLAAAESLYKEILQTEPQHVDALHFLGVLKNQNGEPEPAIDLIRQAIKLYPDNAAAHINLAVIFQALNRFDEALVSYDKVLSIQPNDLSLLLSRATVLQMLNRHTDALKDYDHTIMLDTNHAEAWFGRANVLYQLKQFVDAVSSYDRSLAINPHSAQAFYNRGIVLRDLNRIDEAINSYQQALVIKPDYAEVHNNLGILLKKQDRYSEAEASFRQACAIQPDYSGGYCNLINHLLDQGQISEAKATLNTALTTIPESLELHFLQLLMTLPMMPKTATESALAPAQFDNALTELSNWLSASAIRQENLSKSTLLSLPFLLAYRPGNHVQRLSRFGDLIAVARDSVTTRIARKKLKIVVISHHFRRHSVWDVITRGLLVNLDRSRFELVLYHLGSIEDQETIFAQSLADEWRDTHTMINLNDWLNALNQDAPDIIFYPEIGMDPMSARLASHRIAPLQIASWGHPVTTGFPEIDLYFSGELIESPEADAHYRERLIRLPGTGCCTTPLAVMPEPLPELEAQLATRPGVRFVIAQTLYKFDPADDVLYADIAKAVSNSIFILLRGFDNAWAMDQLVARLEQAFITCGLNPKQHLLVVPWLSMEKFQSLLDLCDVYLDCPSFSGYTTAWQAVHHGLPIVTLEGEFMRQRLAAGLLRKIGITDTIASSRVDYVQLAVKLAEECRDPIRRQARRNALKTVAPKADNDISVVRAFEQTVINAL